MSSWKLKIHTKAEVEAHYVNQKTDSNDAYGQSFVESGKKSIENVAFDDPMTKAYAMITDNKYAVAAGNTDPEQLEKERW